MHGAGTVFSRFDFVCDKAFELFPYNLYDSGIMPEDHLIECATKLKEFVEKIAKRNCRYRDNCPVPAASRCASCLANEFLGSL